MAREGKKNRVNVLVKSTLSASLPVKPGKTYPLATLDHAMAHHSLHLVFYYPAAAVAAAGAGALPGGGGRLTRPAEAGGNWVVRCNDAGMRVLDAQVRGTMEDWWRTATPEEEKELAQWETRGRTSSSGPPSPSASSSAAVGDGLSCAHMYADPMCITLLVKAWGDAHRRACIVHPPFFHSPALRARPTPNLATASVELLRRKASSAAAPPPCPPPPSASPTRASAAAWPSSAPPAPTPPLSSHSPPSSGGASRAAPPPPAVRTLGRAAPHGFFGNALHFSAVTADLADGGWGGAAEAIRAHLDGVEEEEVWSTIDWVESRRDPATETHGEAFQMYGPELTCACWTTSSPTALRSGRGHRPVPRGLPRRRRRGGGADPGPTGAARAGGYAGRTVTVSLPQDQMDKIRHDPVILTWAPPYCSTPLRPRQSDMAPGNLASSEWLRVVVWTGCLWNPNG
ncbi:unnamed protein product [Spirodela intermedia]|uniref:Uncharacterized protein n=1 Tax=Spirodela intermedia TaxID=51605 RepID=A0A7I8I8B2_SPIIN|nr:unnamed protein product [Spirodela intermedia]CAA6653714.1 unnamed protein product [Spirodela intermedia]